MPRSGCGDSTGASEPPAHTIPARPTRWSNTYSTDGSYTISSPLCSFKIEMTCKTGQMSVRPCVRSTWTFSKPQGSETAWPTSTKLGMCRPILGVWGQDIYEVEFWISALAPRAGKVTCPHRDALPFGFQSWHLTVWLKLVDDTYQVYTVASSLVAWWTLWKKMS